jgi:hypothetical protein
MLDDMVGGGLRLASIVGVERSRPVYDFAVHILIDFSGATSRMLLGCMTMFSWE